MACATRGGKTLFHALKKLPRVGRSAHEISQLKPTPYLGLDFEWDIRTEKPTILGVSDGTATVSVPYNEGKNPLRSLLRQHKGRIVFVGHNFLQSELPILEAEGIHIDPRSVEDTILRYWLTHSHLCKTAAKDADGESVRRGAGYMNLWTMLSLTTDLSNYKACREDACEGPCPTHDVYGYNGLDALGPVLALPKLIQLSQLLGVEKLYPMHRDLSLVLYEMRKTGVFVDVPYVEKLRARWQSARGVLHDKETGQGLIPFNPDSPKQLKAYFSSQPFRHPLRDRDEVIKLRNAQEKTINEAIEKLGIGEIEDEETIAAFPEPMRALLTLRDWKEQGNGPDRWFAPQVWNSKKGEYEGYVDEDHFIHAHIGPFTSTSRMQCTAPNLQNVLARRKDPVTGERMKKVVRRAIRAPEGYYLIKSDFSNAENRNVLFQAGYRDIPLRNPDGSKYDLHAWVAKIAEIHEGDQLAIALGGPRDAAKSVQHAGNYLEGLALCYPNDLRTERIQREVRAGARLVYPKWTFQDQIVTFTGVNLAIRMFGRAGWDERRKALAISQKYFGRFPKVRDWQMMVTKQAEQENMVRPPHGYVLRSYGYAAERMKTATATWGSQPIAHLTKLTLLNLWSIKEKIFPLLQVHDEVLGMVPNRIPPRVAAKLLVEAMEIETPEMPGFVCPTEVEWGLTWADTKEITN